MCGSYYVTSFLLRYIGTRTVRGRVTAAGASISRKHSRFPAKGRAGSLSRLRNGDARPASDSCQHHQRLKGTSHRSGAVTAMSITAPAACSDDSAFKPGSHELFEREQQLIFTDRCDYSPIKAVVFERLIFEDLCERLPITHNTMKSQTRSPVDWRMCLPS